MVQVHPPDFFIFGSNIMEKDYCNKCGKCCKNIAVDFEKKILFRDGVQTLTKEFADMMIKEKNKGSTTLCSCRYLKDTLLDNL